MPRYVNRYPAKQKRVGGMRAKRAGFQKKRYRFTKSQRRNFGANRPKFQTTIVRQPTPYCADRKFATYETDFLTVLGVQCGSGTATVWNIHADAYGFIQSSMGQSGASYPPSQLKGMIWAPQRDASFAGGVETTVNNVHFLPGNALNFATVTSGVTGDLIQADRNDLMWPTGLQTDHLHYRKYLVRGSKLSIEVLALHDLVKTVGFELLVLPITTDQVEAAVAGSGYYDLNPGSGNPNMNDLLRMLASDINGGANTGETTRPGDQAFCKRLLINDTNSGGTQFLSNYMTTEKIYGLKGLDKDDENWVALPDSLSSSPQTASENPQFEPRANPWIWMVYVRPVVVLNSGDITATSAATTQTNLITFRIKIKYFVEWRGRRLQNAITINT